MANLKLSEIGHKGIVISQLIEKGYTVPQTIFLDVSFCERYFAKANIEKILASHLKLDQKASIIRERLNNYETPADLKGDIVKIIHNHLKTPMVVRPSALHAENMQFDFSGFHQGSLNLKSISEILLHIKKSYDSLYSYSMLEFCEQKNISPLELKMGLILQEFVQADFCGVCFTIDPNTGEDKDFVVRYCKENGQSLFQNEDSLQEIRFSWKGELPNFEANESNLNLTVLDELKQIGSALQLECQYPQEIEFAVSNNRVYLLNQRKLKSENLQNTALSIPPHLLFDESPNNLISPLLWSLWQTSLQNAILQIAKLIEPRKEAWPHLKESVRLLYGRPIWEVQEFLDLVSNYDIQYAKSIAEDLSIYKFQEPVNNSLSKTGINKRFATEWRLSRFIKKQFKENGKLISGFNPSDYQIINKQVKSLSDEELQHQIQKQLENEILVLQESIIANQFSISILKTKFLKNLKAITKNKFKDISRFISSLGSAKNLQLLEDLNSTSDLLEQTPKLRDELFIHLRHQEHLATGLSSNKLRLWEKVQKLKSDFCYKSTNTLDLLNPRWGENPIPLLELLSHLRLNNRRPLNAMVDSHNAESIRQLSLLEETLNDRLLLKLLPYKKRRLFTELHMLRQFLIQKENIKTQLEISYFKLRTMISEQCDRWSQNSLEDFKGNQIGDLNKDIYSMDADVLVNLINKKTDLTGALKNVLENWTYQHSFDRYQNPTQEEENHVGLQFLINSQKQFSGVVLCNGSVSGKAITPRHPSELTSLSDDAILVVPYLDNQWLPYLGQVSGIVAEHGNSSGAMAMLVRELGLPTLIGVDQVTKFVLNGQKLALDCVGGTLQIQSDEESIEQQIDFMPESEQRPPEQLSLPI